MDYLDFDLEITRLGPDRYRAGVRSPAGEAAIEFVQPFKEFELENFILKIGHTRKGTRRLNSPEWEAAEAFGKRLFEAVFQGNVRDLLTASLNQIDDETYRGLRIRLRLVNTPELNNWPWEYLYHPSLRQFVVLSTQTPLVRYLDLPRPPKSLTVTPPLRLLVMISDPKDYSRLNVAGEKDKIAKALNNLAGRGVLKVEWLETATLVELQNRLRKLDPVHIFHFIGHGGWDTEKDDGYLLLTDEHGDGRKVDANRLATILGDHKSLRLAVLNACEGARGSVTDPFAGTAVTLVNLGLPAVLAMQFEISDPAAIQMAQVFYESLADGLPVEGAVAEARKMIFADGNDVEWGTPVLYLRANDGKLFDLREVGVVSTTTTIEAGSKEPATAVPSRPSPRLCPTCGTRVGELATKCIVCGTELGSPAFIAKPQRQETHLSTPSTSSPRLCPTCGTRVGELATKCIVCGAELGSPGSTAKPQRQWRSLLPERPKFASAEPSNAPELIRIPAGEFLMGSDKAKDPNAQDDELPQRRVHVSEFYMGRYPITNAQYAALKDVEIPKGKENHPVVNVTWNDAQSFCQWLSEKTGKQFRLPTEAEWEKAARGTDGRIYPWGNEWDNAKLNSRERESYAGETTPVGKYSPSGDSPYGLADMIGNVWEWCADWYYEKEYQRQRSGVVRDPSGSTSGIYRVLRGSSFYNPRGSARCAVRRRYYPNDMSRAHGLRVVTSQF